MAEERGDVIVVGHGIAGLATAVSALEQGLSVTILERAPIEERGGNTRWTEAFMRMKNEDEVSDDFESHFMANAGHHLDPGLINHTADPYESWPSIVKSLSFSDPEVVGTLAAEAGPTLTWLKRFGIRFSDMPSYLITQSTTRICPVGGGLALIDTLAAEAEKRGARIHYNTTAQELLRDDEGCVIGLRATRDNGERLRLYGEAVVLACGGFEGNAEMQARYLGPHARYLRPVARGGYYNKGDGIRMALAINAAPCGDFAEYHAEPIDPRSGRSEAIVFVFPYGILVNQEGQRFVDEGSHTVDAIYENIARIIARLPGGIAYVICDEGLDDVPNWQRTLRSDQPPVIATTVEELAGKLGLPAGPLEHTLRDYNQATRPGEYHPLRLDGLATHGLRPPKSNWQRTVRSDQPPVIATTVEELAGKLGLPAGPLEHTLRDYNQATRPGEYHPLRLDGLATQGLRPPKSNWARPLNRPPYRAWPITTANCFTFGGLRCDAQGRVLDTSGVPLPGLYAVGEISGLYYGRYTGATSVLRGAVFGRLAGRDIARRRQKSA